jgi:hypothetical protein
MRPTVLPDALVLGTSAAFTEKILPHEAMKLSGL